MTASLTLMRALFATAMDVSPTAGSSGWANLATPDPKEVAILAAGGGYWDMDLGASVTADTFFLGFCSNNSDLAVNIYTATGLGTGRTLLGALSVGPATARRRHAFLKIATPSASRYWAFNVTGAAAITAGLATIGQSIQPVFGHEWGSGRLIRDMSQVTDLRGGGFGIERGARAPGWQFTVGDLSDAEVASLWDMVQDVGMSAPVVVCEDPSLSQPALNEALHYGLLDRPEAYSREAPGTNRWSFRTKDWV